MASARTTFVACLLLAVTAVGARNLARDIREYDICKSAKFRLAREREGPTKVMNFSFVPDVARRETKASEIYLVGQ